jgi:WD40 repeat protein
VWRADGSGEPRPLEGHTGPVTSAAFSPDGRFIVTTSQDGIARVWGTDGSEKAFGEPLRSFHHDGPIQSAAFSSDGRLLVTASWDATALVWLNDDSGRHRVLKGHEGLVRSAAFSADDRRIVTASWDGTARIWLVPDLETPLPQIRKLLEEQDKDCLPPSMLQTYFEEEAKKARRLYEQCKREHHRVPS